MHTYPLHQTILFRGLSAIDIEKAMQNVSYTIRQYEKGQTVFGLMEEARQIGLVLEGKVQAQKYFSNGSQINVSFRKQGDIIGAAAAFSSDKHYPCEVVALEPTKILMFYKSDLLQLMQKDVRILNNFTTELASTTYLLQQRLELLSYSGIAQKAAFYLLIHQRHTGQKKIRIPGSVSNWALIMNVSRSSLHRELKKLEDKKILRYQPPIIEIVDAQALQELLG
ncbi:MAG: Crp/Fnr family transcriptional regulator [Erysipelotrichaceae bacterium]|nr:Crp/Fnr family transcriptional regulator [Erysipelotrichaceae bacterium]